MHYEISNVPQFNSIIFGQFRIMFKHKCNWKNNKHSKSNKKKNVLLQIVSFEIQPKNSFLVIQLEHTSLNIIVTGI